MNTKFLGTTAAAALTFFAAPALAVTLTIDQFDGDQLVSDTGGTNASQVAGPNILGGFRDLQIDNTAADGNSQNASELRVTGGNLSFSNIDGARSEGFITYDGDDDPTTLDTDGLGGVNLLIGDNPFFAFDVVRFDRDVFIEIDAYDTNGNMVSYAENLSTGFNPNLTFAELTGDPGFDFGSVGALQFFVSSTNTDISVDGAITSIEVRADDVAPIPLPASSLLLLAGLGGLGAARRFRKA